MTWSRQATPGRWAWTAGALLGAIGGLFVLVGGIFGLAFVALALGLIGWKGPRLASLAGLLTGFGVAWIVLFLRADLSCAAMNAANPGTCFAGDLTAWYAAAGLVVSVGLVLSILALRRRR